MTRGGDRVMHRRALGSLLVLHILDHSQGSGHQLVFTHSLQVVPRSSPAYIAVAWIFIASSSQRSGLVARGQ